MRSQLLGLAISARLDEGLAQFAGRRLGDSAGLDLWRTPSNRDSGCNAGFTEPIDFIVFDDRAWGLVDETSFAEIVYDADDWDAQRWTPSDHCPIVVLLDWPATD